jgi:hypothetical protein
MDCDALTAATEGVASVGVDSLRQLRFSYWNLNGSLLMQNLPTITPAEIAVVAAAVLLFYVLPVLFSWNDARRRWRLQRQVQMNHDAALAAAAAHPADAEPRPIWPESIPTSIPESATGMEEMATAAEHSPADNHPVFAAAERSAPPELSAPTAPAAAEPPSLAPVPLDSQWRIPSEILPLEGMPRHHFRLADLHQAHLPNWPPALTASEPERQQAWRDAEGIGQAHHQTVASVPIASPYPARSVCLGSAESNGSNVRLRYLLFPALWPFSQNQAVAQAVFELDRDRREIRGWVDALRPAELTEDHRREIRESGGEA